MSGIDVRNTTSSPLRLALLYTPLVTFGGGERQFLEEARLLHEFGHHVILLTFSLNTDVLVVEDIGETDIGVLQGRGALGKLGSLRRALARLQPDLLVAHTSPELTWLATRRSQVPYVLYHNSPPYYIGPDAAPYMVSRRYRRVFPQVRSSVAGYEDFAGLPRVGVRRRATAEVRTWLKHAALRGAQAIVVLSERTRRELRLLHDVEAVVVRGCLPATAPHRDGLESARRSSPHREGQIILSVSRLECVKRVDLLLRAFARLASDFPETVLVVGGDGAERSSLAQLALSLGLGDRVQFLGFVPEHELSPWLATADVFAAPAMADFNIAPYEALAAGCKVVWTTEMETTAELQASGSVFAAEPEERAFARALKAALRSPDRPAPDLSSMTWEARNRMIEAVYGQAARRTFK